MTARLTFIGVLLLLAALCFMRAAWLVKHGVYYQAPGSIVTAGAIGITRENVPDASEMQKLMQRRLLIPVMGVDRMHLRDNFYDMRGGGSHRHDALDIMAPRGTPVVAADSGRISKLMRGGAGGNTIYESDLVGKYAYYYAHLDRYAANLREGSFVVRGDVIGYVGTTGDATRDAPHLHFAILKVGRGGRLWSG